MKTIMFFLFTFSILNVCKSQFVYVSAQYGMTEQKSNTGLHVGFQFRDKERDNKRGFIAEFTAATQPGKIIGGGSLIDSPDLLFLQGGYTFNTGRLQAYLLSGIALHSIGIWTKQNDVINESKLLPVFSGRLSYGSCFIQGNYLKNDAGVELGFIFKFVKD